MAYLEDITIFSKNEEEHIIHIEIIFSKVEVCMLQKVHKAISEAGLWA